MLQSSNRIAVSDGPSMEGDKTRVFLSYSRKDSDFANWLRFRLQEREIDVFQDVEDTLAGEDWWRRLQELISQADTIIFVLSPNSVASTICRREVAHALQLNKRVFPVVITDINWALAPDGLIKLHGLFFNETSSKEEALTRLVQALETDIGWIREHTRLGELAQHWDRQKRPRSLLLRSTALEAAEHWLTERPKTARSATNLQQEYIRASRHTARQRLRGLVSISFAVAAVTTLLGIVAVLEMLKAQANERRAELERSKVLSGLADQNLRNGDPVTAALLAMEAFPNASNNADGPAYPEAEHALRDALREQRERLVFGGKRLVRSALFNPGGKLVAAAVNDGSIQIWDAETGKRLSKFDDEKNLGARTISFNPTNSAVVLVGDEGGNARIFDLDSGKLIHRLPASSYGLRMTGFDQKGQLILAAGLDHSVSVWDSLTGAYKLHLVGHHGSVGSAMFSPDGSRIVTASDDMTARVWDVNTGGGRAILQHEGKVGMAVFSPDGQRILTASHDKMARLWNANTGVLLTVLSDHEDAVLYAGFSPDGHNIVTTSRDKTARIWDTPLEAESSETIKSRVLLGHTGDVYLASFSENSRRVVTASNDLTARVWDVETGTQLVLLKGHSKQITSANFNGYNGETVLTAGEDGSIRIWDVDRKPKGSVASLRHDRPVPFAHFSRDGQLIVSAESNTAHVWDASAGRSVVILKGHDGEVVAATFSPDAKKVVTASRDGTARVWDSTTGRQLHTLEIGDQVNSVVYNFNGSQILTASKHGIASIWDSESGKRMKEFKANALQIINARFSPDGHWVLICSADRTARIWDVKSDRSIVLARHEGQCRSAMFNPKGTQVVTADDTTVRLWQASTGQLIKEVKVAAQGRVVHVGFDPFARQILIVTTRKPFVKLWNIARGNVIDFSGHDNPVTSAEFSPGGEQVLTASKDGSLRVWDAVLGYTVDELKAHEVQIGHAEFSPDGERMLTASNDNTVRLWESATTKRMLFKFVERKIPRCLEPLQRKRFGLDDRVPPWCIGKWPYTDE
jgi:WD40 repeat protein